jgi:hypothetical protein
VLRGCHYLFLYTYFSVLDAVLLLHFNLVFVVREIIHGLCRVQLHPVDVDDLVDIAADSMLSLLMKLAACMLCRYSCGA